MSAYQGGDPANYPQASIGFDYDAVDARTAPQEQMRPAEALFKLIAFLVDSTDYLLRLDVAIAATGAPLYLGKSYTEMATKHKISKQAFDKHVLKFQKEFQLPITRSQKSVQARLSYKKHQLDRLEHLEQLRKGKQQQKERTIWQNSLERAPRVQQQARA
jgi:hypothetical protein